MNHKIVIYINLIIEGFPFIHRSNVVLSSIKSFKLGMSNYFPSSDFGCKLLRFGRYFPAYWQWKKFLACKAWKGGDATDLDIHSRSYFPTFAERKTLKADRRQWVIGKNRRSRPCQVKETQTIEWYRNQSEKWESRTEVFQLWRFQSEMAAKILNFCLFFGALLRVHCQSSSLRCQIIQRTF